MGSAPDRITPRGIVLAGYLVRIPVTNVNAHLLLVIPFGEVVAAVPVEVADTDIAGKERQVGILLPGRELTARTDLAYPGSEVELPFEQIGGAITIEISCRKYMVEMKILRVHAFPFLGIGGIESTVHRTLEEVTRTGTTVRHVHVHDGVGYSIVEAVDIAVERDGRVHHEKTGIQEPTRPIGMKGIGAHAGQFECSVPLVALQPKRKLARGQNIIETVTVHIDDGILAEIHIGDQLDVRRHRSGESPRCGPIHDVERVIDDEKQVPHTVPVELVGRAVPRTPVLSESSGLAARIVFLHGGESCFRGEDR